VRRRALVLALACASALTVVAAALAGNGGFLPAPAHSPNAHRIVHTYVYVAIFTGVVFVGVEGVLIAFVIRYRRGKRARTVEGPQIHGSTRLEILWTVLPVVILAAIGSFVFYELPKISNAPAAIAANETTITVEGRQFYWLFRYPNGAISLGTMMAPAGEVVNEDVVSPTNDVLHSWWIPSLGGKIDAIPGRTNKTWFEAPLGTYAARCSDLCGIQHAKMTAHVDVVPRAQYDKFIAQRKSNSSMALGREEFQEVCSTCHRLDKSYVGPALGDNPLLTDAKGLSTILRQGVGRMPAVGSDWSKSQIDALVGYTKTLTKTKEQSGN
jgi:cytochrome c oxidase subunit 2